MSSTSSIARGRTARITLATLLCAAGTGCGSPEDDPPAPPAPPPTVFGGDRPVELFVPAGHDPATPAPLLVLLHGYGVSGAVQDLYWALRAQALERGFLYAHPDGTVDSEGHRFWNATDACCNFDGASVDDSGYLMGLVDAIAAAYAVDPKRVYFTGHSNGGFMSFRMACDHADRIAAIASLAGATYADPSACAPSEPVHVLALHGTADDDILYDGGTSAAPYPGAVATAETWASYDGCSPTADTSAAPLDLDEGVAGAETAVQRWATGCDPGGSAELWSMTGVTHIPTVGPDFTPSILDFLLAHPKP
ncbi:MAG: prolyl oligopeptidase family serine peptidase [Polyangiaceae bacterium]|nr:prolyl oligopeptidase family serine peptidase [Polyangiaceae bacterium]